MKRGVKFPPHFSLSSFILSSYKGKDWILTLTIIPCVQKLRMKRNSKNLLFVCLFVSREPLINVRRRKTCWGSQKDHLRNEQTPQNQCLTGTRYYIYIICFPNYRVLGIFESQVFGMFPCACAWLSRTAVDHTMVQRAPVYLPQTYLRLSLSIVIMGRNVPKLLSYYNFPIVQ